MKLSGLKSDKNLLLSVLPTLKGRRGKHYLCPFHDERTPSFTVFQGRNGIWRYCCFGCGIKGTVIDAAMQVWGLKTCRQAVDRISSELGVRVMRDVEYQEPVPDLSRAERFIADCHEFLLGDYSVQEKLLVGKRGITDLEVVKRFRIGWAEGLSFQSWRSWRVTGWTIPITDSQGGLLGVKIHQEGRRSKDRPKSLWAPFGTYPRDRPKHGTGTLFPRVEIYRCPGELYIAPGELKALALINAGYSAVSPTTGESRLPYRLVERIRNASPGMCLICYDDDPAGLKWRDAVQQDLKKAGLVVGVFSLSQPQPPPPTTPAQPDQVVGVGSPGPTQTTKGVSPVGGTPGLSGPPPAFEHPGTTCQACGCGQYWQRRKGDRTWKCVLCFPPRRREFPRRTCSISGPLVVFGQVGF